MIIGKIEEIGLGKFTTHNQHYAITDQTHIFVARPFRLMGLGIGGALCAFTWGCADLLYLLEIGIIGSFVAGLVFFGERAATLSVINRDLPGSELSTALWGSYSDLNQVRRNIGKANPKLAVSTHAAGSAT